MKNQFLKIIPILLKSPLFKNLGAEEIPLFLESVNGSVKKYGKGEAVLHSGQFTENLGFVVSGRVQVENMDFWGNRSILDSISQGMVFAETYALMPDMPLFVDVTSCESSEILFMNMELALKSRFSSVIMQNLLEISLRKNLVLSQRIFCTSPRTIRGKLLIYLSQMRASAKSDSFRIPFNRQQLADFLNTDRSALSAELGRMQKEGILVTFLMER